MRSGKYVWEGRPAVSSIRSLLNRNFKGELHHVLIGYFHAPAEETRRSVPYDDGIRACRKGGEREGPARIGLQVPRRGHHDDYRIHIGMEMTVNLDDARLIKFQFPRLPCGVIPQVKLPRRRERKHIVEYGVLVRKGDCGTYGNDHDPGLEALALLTQRGRNRRYGDG